MRHIARCMLGLLCIVLVQGHALAVQTPLPGSAIPQFVDPLPIPHIITAGTNRIELRSTEFLSRVLPSTFVPANGLPYAGTWVWGYLEPNQISPPSYIGPVIVAERGTPTELKFVNNLGSAATTNVLAYRNSTDQTLHWADPLNNGANMCMMDTQAMMPPMGPCAANYLGTIPDYAPAEIEGLKISGVRSGGPADKAGLQGGDVIVELAGKAIKNIYDYTYAMDALKVGVAVPMTVVRGGEKVTLTITPEARQ